jgi:hypothetical protein
MLVLKLVPAFFLLLFLQLSAQVQLPSGQAYAWWCCADCNSWTCGMCNCPGKGGCPYCNSGDTNTVQSPALLIDKATADIRAVRNLDAVERVRHLTKVGDCARRDFALRILGDARESLKVKAFGLGEKGYYDDIVAVRVTVNDEQ